MKKKILVVGSSYGSLPILEYLRREGSNEIAVVGKYENDPGHLFSDKSYFVDYSNEKELLNICLDYEPDFIVPTCNDYSYNSSSYVNEKLGRVFNGFDDYDTTMLLHTKHLFREFLVKNNISSPKYYEKEDINEEFENYPILIKPSRKFSGIGIKRICNYEEFKKEIRKKETKGDHVVIEEFVEGSLYSYSVFIEKHKVKKGFFVREFCLTYPYQVDFSYVDNRLPHSIKKKINEYIEKIIDILGLSRGLFHVQLVINNNDFFIIEAMRRCPGDLYNLLIEKTTGFRYIENYVNAFLGKEFCCEEKFRKNIIRHTITVNKVSTLKSLTFKERNIEFFPLKESGYTIKKAPFDKIGIIFKETSNTSIENTIKDIVNIDYYEGVKP
ncbi:ATP-grasp domain-containing protein [Hippea sp. KM1]|uniref:ATP-grasp domain-containing protein n=1 Tax=Hippea sp. KM1 TaxID=944481 RepID=UPI00046D86AF|nr:ATP-grasp domain-containing protein [Hippea sp. KM1]